MGQAGSDLGHGTGPSGASGLDQLEHGVVKTGAHVGAIGQRHHAFGQHRIRHTALVAPQIGRMDAFDAQPLLHVTVLGKQADRRHLMARQHRLQVFADGKAGTLDHADGVVGATRRGLDERLRHGLQGPHHQRHRCHAHHLKGSGGLVHLLARQAQRTHIGTGQLGAMAQRSLAHMAAQGLDRAIKGFAQFVQHPGQRAQVMICRIQGSGGHSVGGSHEGFQSGVGATGPDQAILNRATE